MEPPSAPPRGGHVPWQELLLAVSLLTFWNPPTTAQVTVESVPPDAAEGKDVLLRVHNLPGDLLGCNWFRGETVNTSHQIISYVVDTQVTTPGPAHSGRETIYPNGSLLFQRVTLNGTGYYTLQIVRKNAQVEQGTGQIRVFPELPKPNITSNNSDPVENADSVVLTCEPQTQSTSYLWSVNSKSLPASARLELSLDNRTLTIHRVTRNDTGPYQCETRNPVSADGSDPFTLNVLYGPDAPTISPSDSHYRPGASLRLSCHAASNPPARYSWLINGRPQPSTQELFIPSLTANDSGAYTCIASNSGTRLNKTTVQTITVSGDSTQPSSGLPPGAIAGIVIGVLAGVAVIAALVYFLFTRKSGGYDDLSSCSASPRLTAVLERGKETLPLSLHLDLLLLLSTCFSALTPVDLFFMLPGPHSLGHSYSHPHLV
ncbi:carcinoembryonic antigen-related cell adhesion molecule 1 isoform X1 [Ursus maritimus]|uniref:CEA cell adhesion molecule 1 n=1 Tax=Ursus maritimus TaxID=29073 RepID=A0A452T2X9_URSMA|nr:carcinoembryonic antigen-related cell adhesion molecule 1 isoform X1 [Ursus maritimus]